MNSKSKSIFPDAFCKWISNTKWYSPGKLFGTSFLNNKCCLLELNHSPAFWRSFTKLIQVSQYQPETCWLIIEKLRLIVVWRRLFRVPWTARRSNQSILKEINPECSSDGLMLKLKLQYLGDLMQRAWCKGSLEKTLMLVRGRRQQRMRSLESITDSMDVNLSKLWEIVKDRWAWHGRVTKEQPNILRTGSGHCGQRRSPSLPYHLLLPSLI